MSDRALFAAAACAYIPRADGRVLFVKHSSGTWCLPGGKTDENEAPAKTAVREAGEETGLRVTVERMLVYAFLRADPEAGKIFGYPCLFSTWLCTASEFQVDSITIPDGEILDYRWMKPAEALHTVEIVPYIAENIRLATIVHLGGLPVAYQEA